MSKIENEVKVLGINPKEVKENLKKIGAEYKGKKDQKIYVYDVPTLYYRFLEIRELLKTGDSMIINTNLNKLKTIIVEFLDLADDKELKKLENELNSSNLENILSLPTSKIVDILYNPLLEKEFENYKINPNKWIRLRQSNEKVALTSKHILTKKESSFQNVNEIEFEVSSLNEANLFLESIGISRRSYQEKIRYSYVYKTAEIEIDTWPFLETYMEIECDNKVVIDEIITKLNLSKNEIVSLNTEQLYKRIGIDVHSISELKFQN